MRVWLYVPEKVPYFFHSSPPRLTACPAKQASYASSGEVISSKVNKGCGRKSWIRRQQDLVVSLLLSSGWELIFLLKEIQTPFVPFMMEMMRAI